ncbi:Dna2/Cas4 domain-containing protein [Methanococcoides sp. SA1]|nr:Dna2/Cas4 domain-containing protein [Methanococcoides sp. SA1]
MSIADLKLHANVSELLLYLKCPRQVYYTYREQTLMPNISSKYIEHMMLKELAMGYADIVKKAKPTKESILEELGAEFKRVKNELDFIYSTELKNVHFDVIETAQKEVFELLGDIATNLSEAIFKSNKDEVIQSIMPHRTEPVLHSERLKLTGIPSAIVQYSERMVPLTIRTGKCPDNGVWGNDRIHIAALSMLVEENVGETVEFGFVEYAKEGKIRKVKVRPEDRRQVLKIRDRVDKIKDGYLPERKEGKICEHCNFTQSCTTKSTLASKFF